MILPTRIAYGYERRPWGTGGLVVANVVLFLATWGDIVDIAVRYGLSRGHFSPAQLLTSAFLHVDLFHLLGNLLFLWVYGRYVEERLGPARFLGLYLSFAIAGGLAWLAADDGITIGASGAIAGLMGFVLVAAPRARIELVVTWGALIRTLSMSAFWAIGLWLVHQVFSATLAYDWTQVAYSAHFGGFLTGGIAGWILRRPRWKGSGWWMEPTPPVGGGDSVRRLRTARGRPAGAVPGHPVRILSLEGVESRVAVIKRLMVRCALEPEDAKARLDAVAPGAPQVLVLPDTASARVLADELRALGVGVAEGAAEAAAR